MCGKCTEKTHETKFEKHIISETHLIIAGGRVRCKICKSVSDLNDKKAQLKSIVF